MITPRDRKRIESNGLSSTGNAHKAAVAAETEAYNTSPSRVSRAEGFLYGHMIMWWMHPFFHNQVQVDERITQGKWDAFA